MNPERWPRLSLAVPDGWERIDDGDRVVSIRPEGAGAGGPAVSVTVADRRGTAPEEHLLAVVGQLAAVLSDGHLVSASVVDGEPRIVVAHEMLGVDVTTVQRHVLGPGDEVVVSAATVADLLWPAWRSSLERVLVAVQVAW